MAGPARQDHHIEVMLSQLFWANESQSDPVFTFESFGLIPLFPLLFKYRQRVTSVSQILLISKLSWFKKSLSALLPGFNLVTARQKSQSAQHSNGPSSHRFHRHQRQNSHTSYIILSKDAQRQQTHTPPQNKTMATKGEGGLFLKDYSFFMEIWSPWKSNIRKLN